MLRPQPKPDYPQRGWLWRCTCGKNHWELLRGKLTCLGCGRIEVVNRR